jgi:hypothetical protein
MDGESSGEYSISEDKKFKADVKYLCSEIGVGTEHIETIVNVVKLAALRSPQNLPIVPGREDIRFVFTSRVNRNGIQIPALRVLVKISDDSHQVILLTLASRDVRL